jgi:hypothetical protein
VVDHECEGLGKGWVGKRERGRAEESPSILWLDRLPGDGDVRKRVRSMLSTGDGTFVATSDSDLTAVVSTL